jgi:hypothetical protein
MFMGIKAIVWREEMKFQEPLFMDVWETENNGTIENLETSDICSAAKLLTKNLEDFWQPTTPKIQSSSKTNSWIRIHLKSGVILRDVSVLVNVRDGVHCPHVMRVRFGSSASDFAGDETMTWKKFRSNNQFILCMGNLLVTPSLRGSSAL